MPTAFLEAFFSRSTPNKQIEHRIPSSVTGNPTHYTLKKAKLFGFYWKFYWSILLPHLWRRHYMDRLWIGFISLGLLINSAPANYTDSYSVKEGNSVILDCPPLTCDERNFKCPPISHDFERNFVLWENKEDGSTFIFNGSRTKIFKNKSDQYEVLLDGRLNITRATVHFAGRYKCNIHYKNATARSRGGTVCLDVIVEGSHGMNTNWVPRCKNSTEVTKNVSQESTLELKYTILIVISLVLGLIMCVVIGAVKRKAYKTSSQNKHHGLTLQLEDNPVYVGKQIGSEATSRGSLPPIPNT